MISLIIQDWDCSHTLIRRHVIDVCGCGAMKIGRRIRIRLLIRIRLHEFGILLQAQSLLLHDYGMRKTNIAIMPRFACDVREMLLAILIPLDKSILCCKLLELCTHTIIGESWADEIDMARDFPYINRKSSLVFTLPRTSHIASC